MNATDYVEQAVALLSDGKTQEAETLLDKGLAENPWDVRLHLVHGVTLRQAGRDREGAEAFWRGLAANPTHEGVRQALIDTLLKEAGQAETTKDFSLESGERLVADHINGIRTDHLARYAKVALWLRHYRPQSWTLTGMDVFSGNGYGSRLVADRTGARMLGLDGSAEAVSLAEKAYGSHRVVFGSSIFPFVLMPGLCDFAICFESAEHVDDPEDFLAQISQATSGPLFVSVPLDEGLPFERNRDLFAYHTRHFKRQEIYDLLARVGRPVIAAEWGQMAYSMANGRMSGLLEANQMGLGPVTPQTQFLIMIALPASPVGNGLSA